MAEIRSFRNKYLLISGVLLFLSMQSFGNGCPEVKHSQEKFYKEKNQFFIETCIESPASFRVYNDVKIYPVGENQEFDHLPVFTEGMESGDSEDGMYRISLEWNEALLRSLNEKEVYKLVYDINSFEGCLEYVEIFFYYQRIDPAGAVSIGNINLYSDKNYRELTN